MLISGDASYPVDQGGLRKKYAYLNLYGDRMFRLLRANQRSPMAERRRGIREHHTGTTLIHDLFDFTGSGYKYLNLLESVNSATTKIYSAARDTVLIGLESMLPTPSF